MLHSGRPTEEENFARQGFQEVAAKIVSRLATLQAKTLKELVRELGIDRSSHHSNAIKVAAWLMDLNPQTVYRWGRFPRVQVEWPSGRDDAGSGTRPLTETVGGDTRPLTECVPCDLPAVGGMSAVGDDVANAVVDGERPSLAESRSGGRREQHPNYKIGMTLGSLAMFWSVQCLPRKLFTAFVAWASTRFPNEFGNINNCEKWIERFLPSVQGTLLTHVASDIHTIVPATGMPSFISRVVDVVTPQEGCSYLPIIYVYTSAQKGLQWCLLGSPALEYGSGPECSTPPETASAAHLPLAVGGVRSLPLSRSFRFHTSRNLVSQTHRVEQSFSINREDRKYRLVVTVADQAINWFGKKDQ